MVVQSNSGKTGEGKEEGIFPNRLPIVSTGKLNNCTAKVDITIAISDPGIRRVTFADNTT